MCFIFDSIISFIDELKNNINTNIKKEHLDFAFMSPELYFTNSDLAICLIPEAVNTEEDNIQSKKHK